MKLIFSFWFISPALGQPANSGGGDISTGLEGLIGLGVIVGIIFLVVRNRKRARHQLSREREKLIKDQPPITIREYKGKQEEATKRFQRDAADLATLAVC